MDNQNTKVITPNQRSAPNLNNRQISIRRIPGANQASSQPNLVEVYLDKLIEKNQYQEELVVSKEKF